MNTWKVSTLILSLLLIISLIWIFHQKNTYQKEQLIHYSLNHAQVVLALDGLIPEYEKTGNPQNLATWTSERSGISSYMRTPSYTAAFITRDFDYDIARVLREIHKKALNNTIEATDIERLKIVRDLHDVFEKTIYPTMDTKSVKQFENDFTEFMAYYETQKELLFK
ncbi:MAG: hypothetical protein R3250_00525 [Melioribacteraceae bacterium]|nr:hypothetical protein [Melioribacteraceae bacterium]